MKTASLTSREEPQCYETAHLDWQSMSETRLLAGIDARLLSRSSDADSSTYELRIPPGWSCKPDTDEATLELFVLQGDLALEGTRVGAGGYVFLPRGGGEAELRSENGGQLLAYWNESLAGYEGATHRITSWRKEPWVDLGGIPSMHGVMYKSLRLPDAGDGVVHGGPGGILRMSYLPPAFADPTEHVHKIWEEIYFLSGDLFMAPRGLLTTGTYLANPAHHWHAPMTTQFGSFMLVQTTSPVDQVPREYPNADSLVDGYLDTASWLEPPRHQDWESAEARYRERD